MPTTNKEKWYNFPSVRDKLDALLNRLSNDSTGYFTAWCWILESLGLSAI